MAQFHHCQWCSWARCERCGGGVRKGAEFTGSFVLDEAFRWTDPVEGISDGLFHVIMTGIGWVLHGLIPGLLIHGLFRWRDWQRFRGWAIISPGIVAVIMTISGLISSPPTADHRLKRFTGAALPASAREIRTHFTGGGMYDYGDLYYFRCSASDTDGTHSGVRADIFRTLLTRSRTSDFRSEVWPSELGSVQKITEELIRT